MASIQVSLSCSKISLPVSLLIICHYLSVLSFFFCCKVRSIAVMESLLYTIKVVKEIFTFLYVFFYEQIKYTSSLTIEVDERFNNYFRSWTCLVQVSGMFGILQGNRKHSSPFTTLLFSLRNSSYDPCLCSCGRMSPNMVACIAVESISILEKFHMKGLVKLFSFLLRG